MAELDHKSQLVMEAVYEQGGEATTTEIKSYTGINKNGVIHYRFDKLSEAGLLETRLVDTGETLPVTVATLTADGEDEVGRILDGSDGPTLAEQMEAMVSRVATFDSRLSSIEGELEAIREERAEQAENNEDVGERVDDLEDALYDLADVATIHDKGLLKEMRECRLSSLEALYPPADANKFKGWDGLGEEDVAEN